MAKLIAYVSTFCLLFVFIGFVVYLRVYAPPGSTPLSKDVDAGTVVADVRKLNGLVQVRYVSEAGKVVAGVPLGEMTQYDLSELTAHSVTLHLPAAVVVSVVPGGAGMTEARRNEASGELRARALQNGILEDARQVAETGVRQFLFPVGIREVRFR